jgi:hypothetical protein
MALMMTPQGRATPIEIEIAIEIGKLPEIDFDHDHDFDFDFDFDTELPGFENKNALCIAPSLVDERLSDFSDTSSFSDTPKS